MKTVLAAIALAWIVALLASSRNIGGAGGAFDCGPDCTAFQDLVNAITFMAPVVFVILLLVAAITYGRAK